MASSTLDKIKNRKGIDVPSQIVVNTSTDTSVSGRNINVGLSTTAYKILKRKAQTSEEEAKTNLSKNLLQKGYETTSTNPTVLKQSKTRSLLPNTKSASNTLNEDIQQQKDFKEELKQSDTKLLIEQYKQKKQETRLANTDYNYASINEEVNNLGKVGLVVETAKSLLRGAESMFGTTGSYVNKNGEVVDAPNRASIKQYAVEEKHGTVLKILDDVLFQSGKLIGSQAMNTLVPASGTATYFTDIANQTYNDSRREGYNERQSTIYAATSTIMEFATEKVLGGVSNALFGTGESELSSLYSKVYGKFISKAGINKLLSSMSSEATEEFTQEFLDQVNRNLILGEKNDVFSKETLKNAMYSGLIGGLTAGITNAKTSIDIDKAVSSAEKSAGTRLTNEQKLNIANGLLEGDISNKSDGETLYRYAKAIDAEDTVIDNERTTREEELKKEKYIASMVEDKIKNNDGIAYNEAGKLNLTKMIREEIENGNNDYQSVKLSKKEINQIKEDIEEEIEEGTFSKDKIEKAILGNEEYNKYKELYDKYVELTDEVEKQKVASELTPYLKALNDSGITTNRFRNVYNEEISKSQKYIADKTDETISDYAKKINEEFDKLNVNNSQRSHNFNNILTKLSEDNNVQYHITTNEDLKNKGYALDKNINGLVSNGEVYINIDSSNALNNILGHETTHLLEGTQAYKALQNIVFEYASTKGELESRKTSLTKLYENVENANIDDELTSDLVGEYLFDDEFINNLVKEPTLFQKIFNKIKYLYKLATAGSEEEKQLLKAKNAFEKAYQQANIKPSNETKMMITKLAKFDDNVYNNLKEADDISNQDKFWVSKAVMNNKNSKGYFEYDLSINGTFDVYQKNKQDYKIIAKTEEGKRLYEAEINERIDESRNESRSGQWGGKSIEKRNSNERNDELSNINSTSNNSSRTSITKGKSNSTQIDTNSVSFSLSEDNKGNKLSDNQIEYFENSVLKDNKGNLKVYYNGSGEFNVYDKKFMSDVSKWGKGIYLTEYDDVAKMYGKDVKEVYVNITNPLSDRLKTITFEQYNNLYQALYEGEEAYREEYDMYSNDLDLLWDITNKGSWADYAEQIKEYTGKDGIIINDAEKAEDMVIAFQSNQVKRVSNQNPTDNDDIRYSIGNDISNNNDSLTYGKDIKLQNNVLDLINNINNDSEENIPYKDSTISKENLTDKEKKELEDLQTLDDIGALDDRNRLEYLQNKEKYGVDNIKYDVIKDSLLKKITKNFKGLYEYDFIPTTKELNEEIKKLSTNGNVTLTDVRNIIKSEYNIDRLKQINYDVQEAKNDLRNTSIYVSDSIKSEITDYSSFMQNNYNRLKLSSTGEDVDVVYMELSSKYPELFPSDITNETDEFKRMVEVAKMDTTENYDIQLSEEQINNNAQYLYDSIKEYQRQYRLDKGIDRIDLDKLGRTPTRHEVTRQYRLLAKDELGDLSKFKDKRMGFFYSTNTMKRNLRDIVDQETADRLYRTYFQPVTINDAKANKFINGLNERIEKYDLNNTESTYVQMLGEYKYNPDTTLTDLQMQQFENENRYKINKKKCEEAVEEFKSIYSDLYNEINNTFKKFGYKELGYREGYFPHFSEEKNLNFVQKFAQKLGWNPSKDTLQTSNAGITDLFRPQRVFTTFSQHRTGDATEYNALKGFDNYVRGAADVIYHTEDIQKLRALENEIRYQYSEKGIQEKINEISNDDSIDAEEKQNRIDYEYSKNTTTPLGNFATELRNYTDNLANKKSFNDRSMEQQFGRNVYTTMKNINSRVSANMVGLNISSAMTNFIPITQAYSQVSTKNLLRGIKEATMNTIKNDGFDNNSVYLTNRTNAADRLYTSTLDKISEKTGTLFEKIDEFTSNAIVRGKYYDNIDKGMSVTDAMENADEFAKDVMAGRSKGDQPTAFNTQNPIAKLFTAFQLEVNNQYGYMFKDIPVDVGKDAKDEIAMAFVKMFLGAYLYNWLSEKITGRKSAFSPIDLAIESYDTATSDEDLGDKVVDIAQNVGQELPYIGGILGGGRLPIQAAIPYVGSDYANPVSDIVDTITYLGDKAKGVEIEDDDTRKTAAKRLTNELKKPIYYLALPFGGGQIKKTVEGLSMYDSDLPIAGSYTNSGELRFTADESTSGKIQAALFGQYASENAREYFNENRSPLTKNQITALSDMDIPISKFWEYQDEIKEQKAYAKEHKESQTEAVYNAIESMDLNLRQKNILLNATLGKEDEVTDKNDYVKYKDSNDNVYWYDTENNIVYNSNYHVTKKDINSLTKVSEKVTIKDYNQYDSLEEFNYANKNPEKYSVITQITSYDTYQEYASYIDDIKDEYAELSDNATTSKQKTAISKQKKAAIRKYINSLPLNVSQKLMLEKVAGGYSVKSYKSQLRSYINNLNLTKAEKEELDEALFD